MSADPQIPDGSRAILIGVPHYKDAKYQSYTAVGNSVDGMFQLLVESGLCGWREEQIEKITDPAGAGQLMGRLRQRAAETTGVLLLYFVGHGQPNEHNGDLCLAIADTDHANPDATGLEYDKIKRMLHSGTPATTRIAILDCCYAGRAIGLGVVDNGAQLQTLKGQDYDGCGSRFSPVWAKKASTRSGRYWMRLSRFFTMAVSWSMPCTIRFPRLRLTWDHTCSVGLR